MKLKPTNFYDPEPDRNAWVTRINPDGSDYMEKPHEYQKALSEWKRRQIRPEKPNVQFAVYADGYVKARFRKDEEVVDNHIKDFDYWEEHHLRYKGWELVDGGWFQKGPLNIFMDDEDMWIKTNGVPIYSGSILTHSTFEALMEDNNFELEKI